MSKKLVLTIAIVCLLAVPAVADVTINGSGSGHLTHSFANPIYTDIANVGCANFTLNTAYTTDTVTRDFEILDTYNYAIGGGCSGPNPLPGNLDGGNFLTTEIATGTWVYNDLSYEKVYQQYVPGAGQIHADSVANFTAGTANIYNYVAGAGERSMTQEVGTPSSYINSAMSYTPGMNTRVKMSTTATFGGNTVISGHGAYSPANVDVVFQNTGGLVMSSPATFFNGVDIDFTGNAYNFDFTGVKGAGWNFDIAN